MIHTITHKGLRTFYLTGGKRGIQSKHAPRLRLLLAVLSSAQRIEDVDIPGGHLHKLSGDRNGFWSLRVSGNWRLIFRFLPDGVYDVDYLDYH